MFDNMYDNIGEKIKGLAKIIFFIEAISAIIVGATFMVADDDTILVGLLVIIVSPIVAWVSSWLLYAWGELVEDVHAMRIKQCPIQERDTEKDSLAQQTQHTDPVCEDNSNEPFVPNPSKTVVPNVYKGTYSCPKCGCMLKFGQKVCLCSWQIDWSQY